MESRKRTRYSDDNITTLIEQLKTLGEQLSDVSEIKTIPDESASANFVSIKNQMMATLTDAFEGRRREAAAREALREIEEAKMLEREEKRVEKNLKEEFLLDLNSLTQRMSEQLTYGEQARLYKIILTGLDNILTDDYIARHQEPNQLAKLSELFTIAYNHALEQLAITLSNMYETAPKVTRQTISLLTASILLYNYQPDGIKSAFEGIPYFGIFFKTMNKGNTILSVVSNSIGSLTTLYYLLRNAGIDLDTSLKSLEDMGRSILHDCMTSASTTASAVALSAATRTEQAANFACEAAVIGVISIGKTTDNIFKEIANQLGSFLTREYSEIQVAVYSQESQPLSQESRISQKSTHSLLSRLSHNSIASLQSVQQLVTTPISDGGSTINQNPMTLNDDDRARIQGRFVEIVGEASSREVIATPVDVAPVGVEVGEVISSSQSTISSMDSNDSTGWGEWLFGDAYERGGRRIRKSRRHMKMKRTRKGRKGRKRRMTRKGRKHHKTLKRYRSKGRH